MRKWINAGLHFYLRQRLKIMQRFMDHPHEVQQDQMRELLRSARDTAWGRRYDFKSIRTPQQFAERQPVSAYDDLKPYIQRMMHGEKDVLWQGQVRWFSKSSGTTSDKSKFLPVSNQNLKHCHIRGSWDTMTLFYRNRPDARQFEQKSLVMGGSLERFAPHPKTMYGDVSAIMLYNMPYIGRPFYFPDFATALMDEWEQKLERMAQACASQQRIVMIGGVPTWTVVLLRRILEISGKSNMLEVWPDFQGYIHGGVSFTPYRKQFQEFFPAEQVSYQEIYNASEGYFAVQDDFSRDDMLLLLNNGIYYEFIPMEELGRDQPSAVPLAEVEQDKNYAMVISTNSGLWRYLLGDTVQFTSTFPHRIRITGRTKQFVNAFGEEVIVENTDRAIALTCEATGARVEEYTVAPIYFQEGERGGHEWLVEFGQAPADTAAFAKMLDQQLQKINSDYEAKRYRDIALQPLKMRAVPRSTFHDWMRARGKFGGQHKVPRLSNNRRYIDEILDFLGETV